MHKKIGKDRAYGSGDILADRQTDRQTDTQRYSSQYFATAPVGEVTRTVPITYEIMNVKYFNCTQ